jgi:hypothetical protein
MTEGRGGRGRGSSGGGEGREDGAINVGGSVNIDFRLGAESTGRR